MQGYPFFLVFGPNIDCGYSFLTCTHDLCFVKNVKIFVLKIFIFMPPTSKKLRGAYWFGSVRAVSQSVSQSVCDA